MSDNSIKTEKQIDSLRRSITLGVSITSGLCELIKTQLLKFEDINIYLSSTSGNNVRTEILDGYMGKTNAYLDQFIEQYEELTTLLNKYSFNIEFLDGTKDTNISDKGLQV